MDASVLGVHGIWNLESSLTPEQAAGKRETAWHAALSAGYEKAAPGAAAPGVTAVYYAQLLATNSQGDDGLDHLTEREQRWAWAWMTRLGVPAEVHQGYGTWPLRQGLDWLARRPGLPGRAVLARIMGAFLREVFVYLTRPAVRERVRQTVVSALEEHRPRVVVAHSLGSVVTYEALHRRPDLEVPLLVTLGSPLALPEIVFDALDPEPRDGRGIRPPGVGRWVNIADPGDVIAVPTELGGRFDVDEHHTTPIGVADFHTMAGYLRSPVTAAEIARYA
ncbi:hypothetical protein AB0G04_28415 [Actinoplanes sp. NPDC023801]|uniref:hypothetical protein n=1 Tax=Actinoplanes sp. NPDC023801 TaxID=3154595 RepID=UPI0033DE530B